jgi:hypothetical protein
MFMLFRLFSLCQGEFELGGVDFTSSCRLRGKGEGPYPAGGVGYLRLARLSLWLLAPRMDSPEVWAESYSACGFFCDKMGPFFWGGGVPPAVAPEGDLVFGGKPSRHLTLFNDEIYIFATNWGVGYPETRKLENPF